MTDIAKALEGPGVVENANRAGIDGGAFNLRDEPVLALDEGDITVGVRPELRGIVSNESTSLIASTPMGYKKVLNEKTREVIIVPKPMDHPFEYLKYAWSGNSVMDGISKTLYAGMVWIGIPLAILSVYPLAPFVAVWMLILYLNEASNKVNKVINTTGKGVIDFIKGAGSLADPGKYGYLRGGKKN